MPDEALAALAEVQDKPLRRSWPLELAGYALAGAALTPVLGGGWREATAAAVVGLVVGGIAIPAQRAARTAPMVAPVAAVAASFCAVSLARLGADIAPDVVTLAALVTFLPGHDAHDRDARALDRAPAVRRRQHGERARPAARPRLRRRGRPVDRRQLVRRRRRDGPRHGVLDDPRARGASRRASPSRSRCGPATGTPW